jgi:hypothetical protein
MCASLVSHRAFQRQSQPEPFGLQDAGGGLHPLALARIHRDAAHLQALGPRAVAEAMIELAAGRHGPAEVLDLLARYSRISRAQIALAGADRPMPRHIALVPR